MSIVTLSEKELNWLLDSIGSRFGYQFGAYSQPTIKEKTAGFLKEENLNNALELYERFCADRQVFERYICAITNGTTQLFREPQALLAVRYLAFTLLQNIPYATIWHCGCSTGEEVYSSVILLSEMGLLDRVRLVGTDINQEALSTAKQGCFSEQTLRAADANYRASGGCKDLFSYFKETASGWQIKRQFQEKVSFMRHDLATDGPIGEVHMIFCRNVLLYFSLELVNKVCDMLITGLESPGLLCFGRYEVVGPMCRSRGFTPLSTQENIYGRDWLVPHKRSKCK